MERILDRMSSIERELATVITKLDANQESVEKTHSSMARIVESHDLELNGRGKNEPGLKTRVDSLEGFQSRAKWAIGTIGTSIIGAAVTYFFSWVKGDSGGADGLK